MSIPRCTRDLIGVIFLVSALTAFAGAPVPMLEYNLDTDMAALLYKEKARQNIYINDMKKKGHDVDSYDSCGSVVINSNNQSQGSKDVKQRPSKQNVTIITSPVINAANCGR